MNFHVRILNLSVISLFLLIGCAKQEVSLVKEDVTPGRRVVTGVNASGNSIIVSDGEVPDAARWSEQGSGYGSDLWILNEIPVNLLDERDPLLDYTMQNWPPPAGAIARIVRWEPGVEYPMHSSATIDFVFIISGELELILDNDSTVMRPGDSVVQRGTNHGWRVVGTEPCIFAAVLIDAEPAVPTSCEEVEGNCFELTFDGKSCTYSDTNVFKAGNLTLLFFNKSDGIAAANLVRHTGHQTIQDMIDYIGEEPSTKHHPAWTEETGNWKELAPGESHTWEGFLQAGIYTIGCARLNPLGVWYGGGFTVED